MNLKIGMLFVLALVLLLQPPAGWAEKEREYSGFLEDYAEFEPLPERSGVLIYRTSDADLKSYSKFIIEPIEIWIHPDSEYKGIQPDKLKALSDGFYKALVKELGDDYPVVNEPGPGVALMRFALTNVRLKKKRLLRITSFTPIGAIATVAKKAAGKDVRVAQAWLEGEILDSRTGKRLRAGVDTQAGEKLRKKMQKGKKDPDTSWGDIEDTLEFWAKRLRARLDAARGIKK